MWFKGVQTSLSITLMRKFYWQILRQLLQRRLRGWSQDAGHISQLLHPRDRGIPEDGSAGWHATVLRASQVLAYVAYLLRSGLEYYQKRPAENGGGRVRLPLKLRQGDERARSREKDRRALPCIKKKEERKKKKRFAKSRNRELYRTRSDKSVPETVRIPRDSSRIRKTGKPVIREPRGRAFLKTARG